MLFGCLFTCVPKAEQVLSILDVCQSVCRITHTELNAFMDVDQTCWACARVDPLELLD